MKTKAYVCVCLFNTFIPLNYCKLIGFDTNYLHLLIHLFFSAKELIVVLRERGRERERERERGGRQTERDFHAQQPIKYGASQRVQCRLCVENPRGAFLIVAESKDQREDDGEGEGSQRAHLPLIAIVRAVRHEKSIS